MGCSPPRVISAMRDVALPISCFPTLIIPAGESGSYPHHMQDTIPTSLSPANIGKKYLLPFSLSVHFSIALTRTISINPILQTWFKDSWFTCDCSSAKRVQRWASTLTNRLNVRHRSNPRPSIEKSERSYFFKKPKAKIVPSTVIFIDHWQSRSLGIDFYTFNEKKHRALYLDFSKGLR